MKEFKNKEEVLYNENSEKYYEAEENYVNSEDILNEEDYLDFDNIKFNDSVIIREINEEEENLDCNLLDRDQLVDEFINNFLKTFPNIYTRDQLTYKLNKNLLEIYEFSKEEMSKNVSGEYDETRKMVFLLKGATDRTRFHEFVHALRGKEFHCNELQGIIEGFTAYSDLRFLISKQENFKVSYSNEQRFVYSEDMDFWVNSSYAYAPLVLIAQELEVLYDVIDPDTTLLTSYLKGENIFAKINKIYERYYRNLSEQDEIEFDVKEYEYDIMRTSYSLIEKINSLRLYIMLGKRQKKVTLSKINEIEEELKEILLVINNDPKIDYKMSTLALTTDIPTAEQRLIACLFGEKSGLEKKYTLTDRLNNIKKIDI